MDQCAELPKRLKEEALNSLSAWVEIANESRVMDLFEKYLDVKISENVKGTLLRGGEMLVGAVQALENTPSTQQALAKED